MSRQNSRLHFRIPRHGDVLISNLPAITRRPKTISPQSLTSVSRGFSRGKPLPAMSNSTLLLNAARGCGEQHFGPASCDGSFDFTLLFEQTLLSIVPSSMFLCCFPISLYKLYKLAPKFEASTFRAFKLVKLSTSRRLPCPSADSC